MTTTSDPVAAFTLPDELAAPVLPPSSMLMRPVEMAGAALAAAIMVLMLAGVCSRYVFSISVVWIDEVVSICFLWLAMLGSVIAIHRNEHLRLTIFL